MTEYAPTSVAGVTGGGSTTGSSPWIDSLDDATSFMTVSNTLAEVTFPDIGASVPIYLVARARNNTGLSNTLLVDTYTDNTYSDVVAHAELTPIPTGGAWVDLGPSELEDYSTSAPLLSPPGGGPFTLYMGLGSTLGPNGVDVTYLAISDTPPDSSVNNAECGDKVIKYEVTNQLDQPFTVGPRGPNDAVHHGAFKIADASRSVSFMASIASEIDQDFYVQPQARFVAWNGTSFSAVSTVNLGSVVHLLGDGYWETVTRVESAPTTATHWFLEFAVSDNAAGTMKPDLGTILYLDCVYVSENGLDLVDEPYLDGDVVGTVRGDGFWEGDPHNSTSIFYTAPPPDPDTPPDNDGDDTTGDNDLPGDGGEDPEVPDVEEPEPVVELDEGQVAELILSGIEPSGLCINSDVQLADQFFNHIDSFGVLWIVSDIDGWWTLPDPDIPDFPRGVDDGSYESRGRYTARIFTLTGSFFPPTRNSVRAARDRLIRAADLCHKGAWFATHESDGIVRAAKVWLSGRPEISTVNTSGRTDFSIGLKAPDPIKYELFGGSLTGGENGDGYRTRSFASTATVGDIGRGYPRTYPWSYGEAVSQSGPANNIGNTRVYPIITIEGATLGPITIKKVGPDGSTQEMNVVVGTTASDDTLIINCQNRTVQFRDNPNARFYLDTFTDWIYLDPGISTITFTEETGGASARVTVSWRSGWIG